ncbi:MAG: FAD-dependent oxidoreductase, partial [Dehalococcoidia bacterium]
VQEWLERTVRRPQVRRIMTSLAWTFVYSAALDLVSAEVFVRKLQITLKNPVHYVDGGWQALVDGLRRTAEAAGARIVSGEAVAAVEHDGGRVGAVRLADGGTVPASSVIVATNPHDAVKLLGDGAYPALRGIVEGMYPAQVACLDVALRRLPRPGYPAAEDLDRPLFYSAQSLFARVAPEGEALVHAFKQLDPRQPGDPREDERELEELLDAGQPGWREQVVKRVYLPRIAAVGMLPTAGGGGFAGRPGVQVPGVPNLFLAGDWIGPEGFLSDACMASARQAARLLAAPGRSATREPAAMTA